MTRSFGKESTIKLSELLKIQYIFQFMHENEITGIDEKLRVNMYWMCRLVIYF